MKIYNRNTRVAEAKQSLLRLNRVGRKSMGFPKGLRLEVVSPRVGPFWASLSKGQTCDAVCHLDSSTGTSSSPLLSMWVFVKCTRGPSKLDHMHVHIRQVPRPPAFEILGFFTHRLQAVHVLFAFKFTRNG